MHSHTSLHLSLNREGRWGTTDDFATSFLHFSKFHTALWDLPNSRPVHSLMLSSHLCFCLVFFPLSLCLARWFWPDLMKGRHIHTNSVCLFTMVWFSFHGDSRARFNLTEPIPLQIEHVAVGFVVEPFRPPGPSLRSTEGILRKKQRYNTEYSTLLCTRTFLLQI